MDAEKTLQGIVELISTKKDASELLEAFVTALGVLTELQSQLKEDTEADRAKIQSDFDALQAAITTRLAELKDGERGSDGAIGPAGKDGAPGAPGESIVGPPGPAGIDGSPDMAEDIRNKLELLQGDERLDASAIKGLEDLIRKFAPKSSGGGATGLVGRGRVRNLDLSSSLNGVTKVFNLPAVWSVISVASSSSPTVFRPLIDYQVDLTNFTLTFTDQILAAGTLEAGQTLVVVVEDA